MAYNQKNYNIIKDRLRESKERAELRADVETARLHAQYPELADIDAQLQATGLELINITFESDANCIEDKLTALKEKNVTLQQKRNAFLKANALSSDIDVPKYSCPICKDTGYVNNKMCTCFKTQITRLTFETSGLGYLASEQTFDSFDLSLYSYDESIKTVMTSNLNLCKTYANSFDQNTSKGLLLLGNTGLGKTHLSTAIGSTVIERGFDVMYDTAQGIVASFESKQFNRDDYTSYDDKTDSYLNCDLLIIDDLGTEMKTAFTISCIYNIINTRINHKKPIIISTNLSQQELRARYEDRITSRLFGEFTPLLFEGKDARLLKLYSK